MHMRVYYKYCPRTVHNLAQYEKQNSGPNPVSLVPAEGRCVPNAIKVNNTVITVPSVLFMFIHESCVLIVFKNLGFGSILNEFRLNLFPSINGMTCPGP